MDEQAKETEETEKDKDKIEVKRDFFGNIISQPKIYDSLNNIMIQVGAIEKSHKAGSGNFAYNFRGIDDIYNSLHKLFAENQVFVTNKVLEFKSETEMYKKKVYQSDKYVDSRQYHITIKICFRFTAIDGSYVETEQYGEAIDYNDKGVAMANSMAFKYACFHIFCIPTNEQLDNEFKNNKKGKSTVKEAIATSTECKNFLEMATNTDEIDLAWEEIPPQFQKGLAAYYHNLKEQFEAQGM